jgi:hypothetical protein
MTNTNSLTLFDQLATENILPIIGSQIQCLTITTIDFNISLKLYSTLKSLIIDFPFLINSNQLNSILESEQFNKLNSFKIKSQIHYEKFQDTFVKNVFHSENSLETFEFLSGLYLSYFGFNGFTFQQQLLESMLQLKTFHIYARLNQKPINVENILLTFKNQFWFEHNWTIGIHDRFLYIHYHFILIESMILLILIILNRIIQKFEILLLHGIMLNQLIYLNPMD